MDETPNDSGESPADSAVPATPELPADALPGDPSAFQTPSIAVPTGTDLRLAIRRPAVWGLLVLIAAVLAIQIWILFL